MSAASDFSRAMRQGRRQGSATVVAHYWCCEPDQPARVGLAVGRSVGNSVIRHRVARRLRHIVRPHVLDLPDGSLLVLRATPAAAGATSSELAADVDRTLRRVRGSR
jgi:ribonuclease P protein component